MNKYDRMVRTYGVDATKRLQSSSVYIIGLKRGYAGEICKNLALSGVNSIHLIGSETVDSIDLKSMYYNIVGVKCAVALQEAIQELNSSVSVFCSDEVDQFFPNSTVVVINQNIVSAININNQCRIDNCKMVYMMCSGLAGSIFVDCIEHTVMDTTGEVREPIQVKDITSNGCIHASSNLSTGDMVRFSMVQGTNTDFLQSTEWLVVDTTVNNFKIVSPHNNTFLLPNDFKFINGVVEYVYRPTTFVHKSLTDSLSNLDPIVINLNKVISGVEADAEYQYTSDLILEPVTSLMSGFTSNEIIKLISQKYTPINQIMTWSDFNVLGENAYLSKDTVMNRYNSIMTKMKEVNILMVGCGALGCEWLKNLAMLGCGEEGTIDIVDPDHIEHSNLSRQFLFRPHHVKKSKCLVAKEMIHRMNPRMNIRTHEHKLSNENTNLTEKVFTRKDIVINCLDNVEARRYVDKICFDKTLPLFESGTMGMKGNTMPIIPYITETYSNMSDPSEEKQFPVCTIKNFPNQIIHTIHWARDNFELYNRGPINCNKYNMEYNYLDRLPIVERNQAIEDINYFLTNIPRNWQECVMKAKDSFENNFNHTILQLLHCFPSNHMLDEKTMFWSHGKICPEPLDLSNEYSIEYILATAKLLCRVYGIEDDFHFTSIQCMIESNPEQFKIKPFVSNDVKIAKDDKELATIPLASIEINKNLSNTVLFPQEFEKDDNSNWHIDYITSASNCRAINYSIKPSTKYETKGIAGRIIPAVATTTSTVVGLIGMELIRYIAGHNKCSDYRSWFMNMADNMVIYSEPIEMPSINIGGTKLNGWKKFNYYIRNGCLTLREFVDYHASLFKVPIYMILYGSCIVYCDFSSCNMDDNMVDTFRDDYGVDLIKNDVVLTLISEDDTIEFPPVILGVGVI